MTKERLEQIQEEIIQLKEKLQNLMMTKDNKAIKETRAKITTLTKLVDWESLNK